MTVKKTKTVKTAKADKPGVTPKIETPEPPKFVPEEGGIYQDGTLYPSTYVLLEEVFWCLSDTRFSYPVICSHPYYLGNLKGFRPEPKRPGYYPSRDHLTISTKVSGLKYKDWYRVDSTSAEKKSREAFRKYLTGVLPEFDPDRTPGYYTVRRDLKTGEPLPEKRRFWTRWF
jgi:hypothetical protein